MMKVFPSKVFNGGLKSAFGGRVYVDNNLKTNVVFFCKDCEKIVEVIPVGRKFVYRCKICSTKNVAFGSEKSIKSFYHIKDPGQGISTMTEEEKKAMNADKL